MLLSTGKNLNRKRNVSSMKRIKENILYGPNDISRHLGMQGGGVHYHCCWRRPALALACIMGAWGSGAVGNVVIKRLDSKKENRLVSTEKEINHTMNIPLGPNDASRRLGPPMCPFSCSASFLR